MVSTVYSGCVWFCVQVGMVVLLEKIPTVVCVAGKKRLRCELVESCVGNGR